jgi:hypothetical protein
VFRFRFSFLLFFSVLPLINVVLGVRIPFVPLDGERIEQQQTRQQKKKKKKKKKKTKEKNHTRKR